LSANNGAGVVGDIQTLSVGPLGTSQSTPVFLLIGVGSRQAFTIYIDLYAALTGSASTALSDGVLKGKSAAVPAKTIVGQYQFEISEAGDAATRHVSFTAAPISNLAVISGAGSQSRPAVAVDPLIPNRVAVASNDYEKRTVV